ncbi:MAG: hypothetical protein U0744_21530 [Gemmataceae bacterium]
MSVALAMLVGSSAFGQADRPKLLAGTAKVEITNKKVFPVSDALYVKALVLRSALTTAVIITVDAVAIGEIGSIPNRYLPTVRARLEKELKIDPKQVLVNASHCHGRVCEDVDEKTVRAVAEAMRNLVPVSIGVGVGSEDRISENRRLKLKNGKEADVRHAYSLPPDEEIAAVGPIDPRVGVVRLDRFDGRTLAVVYHFTCHPIMGTPTTADNTADLVGYASKAIEASLGEGATAFFLQGCAGDINPIGYKDVHRPRNAESLGNMLGLTVLKTLRSIRPHHDGQLAIMNETIALPRADHAKRIDAMTLEQVKLLKSLRGTSLNFRMFLPLAVQYGLAPEFPSYYSHQYLHEKKLGREDLARLDDSNRKNLKAYFDNLRIMEEMTRLQTNLALLEKHQETNRRAEMKPVHAEVVALRLGEFVLIAFPGELTVEIGFNLRKTSPHPNTFISGYTNGYLYYTPTAKQLENIGNAQEDSDCLLAPAWQSIFEAKATEMLKKL